MKPHVHRPARLGGALAAVAALLSASGLGAQPPAAQPPAGQSPAGQAGADWTAIEDEHSEDPRRIHGDARTFRGAVHGSQVDCELTMAQPLREGMFTCVILHIDCDADLHTGIGGDELLIRAAVGSRFAPNAAALARDPLSHARVSRSVIEPDERGRPRWIHSELSGPAPTVEGDKLRFRYPLQLVKERGGRYGGTVFLTRVEVQTSCSDQPIEQLHTCNDEGLPIAIDGKDADWSGPVIADPGDELHACARIVDLTQVRVDHAADKLFVCLQVAEPGLDAIQSGDDVDCEPSLALLVEPQYPRYQEPRRVVLTGGRNLNGGVADGDGYTARMVDRCVEVELRRAAGQNRVRVIVHGDFVCTDRFQDRLRLDWAPK